MKIRITFLLIAAMLASCAGTFTKDGIEYEYQIVPKVKEQKSFFGNSITPLWDGTPNPLDTPEAERTNWHPGATGHFGPFGSGHGRFNPH